MDMRIDICPFIKKLFEIKNVIFLFFFTQNKKKHSAFVESNAIGVCGIERN